MSKKLLIAVGGIHYPLSMMKYFIRALERRDDVELWTFGPFTGNWIPWNGGMQITPKYVQSPSFPLPQSAIGSPVSADLINPHFPKEPDLTLLIDAGWHPTTRPLGNIVATIKTDPHALSPAHYSVPKNYSDICFSMQTPYMQNGDIYLPYAYDPTVHYPEELPYEHDVCMIGLHYQNRTALVNRLLSKDWKVYYSIGEIFDEYREIYNKSRVGINWASRLDMNARVWELAAMGVPAVQNTVPDMKTFFVSGDHYLEFTDVDGAEKQVIELLANPDRAIEMANRAMRKVEPHTYDARVQTILERVGLV
jgi:hypothetical protein